MNITLEYLKPEDLPQYKALIDEAFGNSRSLDEYNKRYDPNHSAYKILVAKDEAQLIGTITIYMIDLFTFDFQPTLEIYNVVVAKEYRGTNTASLMFDFMKDFAHEHGYQSASVTCLTEATRAHRFYEKMGFEKLDRERFLLRI
ncbi:MAG: GNAT family N-acetyltransferase [Turicibacter sp.]|nr:GNAT family N-acetyltransferase [Turicibacter sp.]